MTEPKKFRKKPVVVEARQLGRDYDEGRGNHAMVSRTLQAGPTRRCR